MTLSRVSIFLPPASYLVSERAAEDYCDEVVDGQGRVLYLDLPGSVRAVDRDRDPITSLFDNAHGLSARELLQLESYDGS